MTLLQRKADAPILSGRSRTIPTLAGAAVLSAISIWAAAGFTREPPKPAPQPQGIVVGDDNVTLEADAPQWKVLRLSKVEPANVRWSAAFPARVRIDETRASKVGSPLGGRVTQVYVELGQPVKAGDPLFTVASQDIAGLRAEREKAELDLELTKQNLARVRAMVTARALPGKDELEASQQHRQAALALRLAQSKLASLKVSSRADNELTVIAPRDGTVVDKNVLPAQQIQAEPGLIGIADLSHVWVVAELFEADAVGIAEGALVKITSPSIPGLAIDAKVEMVSAVVDPVRHTVPVRVRVPNDGRLLKPNIFAEVRLMMRPPEGSSEIAATALVSDGAKQYVYVQAARGRFVRREVTAGSVREGRAPILSGLTPGEIVVEEGAILLENQVSLAR